jgi:glucose/arabinose dehydrogenase
MKLKKTFSIQIMLFIVITVSGCLHLGKEPAQKAEEEDSSDSVVPPYTVLAEHLRVPWVIAFAGETIYISERAGNIVKIEGGTMIRKPVNLRKNVKVQGEGGFLGFVLSPDFSKTKQAYAYHTYEENGHTLNRVVLLEEKEESWEEVKVFIENIPGSRIHDGGRMAIGPDNHLYITTGDAGREELAQQLDSLAGKILRMSLEGSIPIDNPSPVHMFIPTGIVIRKASLGLMKAPCTFQSTVPPAHPAGMTRLISSEPEAITAGR